MKTCQSSNRVAAGKACRYESNSYRVGFKMCYPPDMLVGTVDIMRPSMHYMDLMRAGDAASDFNLTHFPENAYGPANNPPLCLRPDHLNIQVWPCSIFMIGLVMHKDLLFCLRGTDGDSLVSRKA